MACQKPDQRRLPATSVLILDIDTLRADRLGCYGNDRGTSPSLDALAARGVRFAWTFSQAPNTPPSQASILTGLYPYHHGRVGDFESIDATVPTLAEILRRTGRRTAAFVDGGFMTAGYGTERGFESYQDMKGRGLAASIPAALAWLREHRTESFLLLIHTYDVHSPYLPPEPYRTQFASMVPPPSPRFQPDSETLEAVRLANDQGRPTRLPANDIAYALSQYDAEIRFVDDWIAALVKGLRELRLSDQTILVVLSDHGEEFQEHGSVLHEKLYTTVLHVPLILVVPGLAPRTVPAATQTIDVVPTLLELLQVPSPTSFDGRSLVPLLVGEVPAHRAWAYAQSPFFGQQRVLVIGDLSFHRWLESGRVELYRYRQDPLELQDLTASDPRDLAVMTKAFAALEPELGRRSRRGPTRKPPVLDPETIDQLRALGYASGSG